VNCAHCQTPLPGPGRRDRIYCSHRCGSLASWHRRRLGAAAPPRWQHPALASPDPRLLAAASRARELGQAHGWGPATTRDVLDGLVVLLGPLRPGEKLTLSQVRARRLGTRRLRGIHRITEVLDGMGLLADDTAPAIRTWVDRRAAELPPGFAGPVHAWLLVLLEGDSRARPRSPATVYRYLNAVAPILAQWASTHDHLREVTAAEVNAALDALCGHRLRTATPALRSLFGHAKKHGQVFTDPTTTARATKCAELNLVPMTDTEIRAVERAAESPAQRLIVVLAAVHAARNQAIRDLTLDDIDIPNRRITIAGHRRRLDDLTRSILQAWLDHRRATWPHTPNRHVLIAERTALGTGPVSHTHLHAALRGTGFTIERIRADRILHEALTAGPDPLHLALVFNLSHATATRYSMLAEHLLDARPEQPGPPSPADPAAANPPRFGPRRLPTAVGSG
jgi:hypothetical protein